MTFGRMSHRTALSLVAGSALAACAATPAPATSASAPTSSAPVVDLGAIDAPGKSGPSDGPLDATALVSPITVKVDRVRTTAGGDCATTRLRVHLTDAKGTAMTREVGNVTGMASDPEQPGFLSPAGDAYSDAGSHCAGLREGVTLRLVGAALVRESAWADSESGEGKETKSAVTFAPGAKVLLE